MNSFGRSVGLKTLRSAALLSAMFMAALQFAFTQSAPAATTFSTKVVDGPSAKLLAKIFAADAKCSVLTTLERDELRGLLLEAQESFTAQKGEELASGEVNRGIKEGTEVACDETTKNSVRDIFNAAHELARVNALQKSQNALNAESSSETEVAAAVEVAPTPQPVVTAKVVQPEPVKTVPLKAEPAEKVEIQPAVEPPAPMKAEAMTEKPEASVKPVLPVETNSAPAQKPVPAVSAKTPEPAKIAATAPPAAPAKPVPEPPISMKKDTSAVKVTEPSKASPSVKSVEPTKAAAVPKAVVSPSIVNVPQLPAVAKPSQPAVAPILQATTKTAVVAVVQPALEPSIVPAAKPKQMEAVQPVKVASVPKKEELVPAKVAKPVAKQETAASRQPEPKLQKRPSRLQQTRKLHANGLKRKQASRGNGLAAYSRMTEDYYRELRCRTMSYPEMQAFYRQVVHVHRTSVAAFGVPAVAAAKRNAEARSNVGGCS